MGINIASNMLVKDMIEAIANKELKVADLAEVYKSSDRTIQTKIKKLGFVWSPKEAKYNLVGNDESVFNLTIDEVFKSNLASNKAVKTNIEKASKEVVATVQNTSQNTPETKSDNASNTTSEINSKKKSSNEVTKASLKAVNNTSDNIDRLLAGKKVKKAYRGFYFDDDVLSVIDSVNSGVKSELINECLRKVFKDKGLL